MDFIAVSPIFRELGIGRKLINYCKTYCEKEFLTLHVAKNNANAVHLYQSEGFEIDKDLSSLIGSSMTGIKESWFMRWGEMKR
ncbi:GNAT family N-acetyltransferase [Vagococcus fluvialis]|nr:GNAT family N-acetyltransferase [Vagococcus fluvialis]NKD50186.1 GNAT family N-acetyltransferase [Vagococcus fluvialis]